MKRNWKPILFAALTFVLGIVCGSALTVGFMIKRFERLLDSDTAQVVQLGSSYLARNLKLDEAQRTSLQPITNDVAKELHALRSENSPRVRQIFETAAAKLTPLLRPEQRAKLDELMNEHRDRWERLKPMQSEGAAKAL